MPAGVDSFQRQNGTAMEVPHIFCGQRAKLVPKQATG
jgi:hypothetical protein